MSAGGKSLDFSQIEKGFNDFANFFGYDPGKGKWFGSGSFQGYVKEGIGEVMGTNMQRHALGEAGEQQIAANKQAAELVRQQKLQDQQLQMELSQRAQASQVSSNRSPFNFSTPSARAPISATASELIGADEKNYLGI